MYINTQYKSFDDMISFFKKCKNGDIVTFCGTNRYDESENDFNHISETYYINNKEYILVNRTLRSGKFSVERYKEDYDYNQPKFNIGDIVTVHDFNNKVMNLDFEVIELPEVNKYGNDWELNYLLKSIDNGYYYLSNERFLKLSENKTKEVS